MKNRKVLIRLPRIVRDGDTGRDITLSEFEKHYVEAGKDYHMNRNIIVKDELSRNGRFTSKKEDFAAFDSKFIDDYKQLKRRAQIITLKDLGPIVAYCGLNRDSRVISAGAGSGAVGCFLGAIVKHVDEFDILQENCDLAKENADMLGLKNVNVKLGDITAADDFSADSYDAFVLDVPEPWKALNTAVKVLKVGGFLVIYCPNITQVQEAILKLPGNLLHEKTIEIIEREWSLKDKIVRPVTKDFGHTAFLGFVRKIY